MKPFLVFPMLHTERLKLRRLTVDDVPALVSLANNKAVSNQIMNMPYPYTEANAVHRLSYIHEGFTKLSRFIFAIEVKESQTFIGEISIHFHGRDKIAELGYWIGEPYWQQGYTKEAALAVRDFAFDRLELDLLYATCHEDNVGSLAVATHIGMESSQIQGHVHTMKMARK